MANPNKEQIVVMTEHILNEQSKFMYYMIALAVTSIGYSVHISMDLKFVYMQIPLALAIICWGFSVYSGLTYLSEINALAKQNIRHLQIKGERTSHYISEEEDKLITIIETTITRIISLYHWNKRWFYSGLFFFVVWWGLRIYSNSYILDNITT